MAVERVAGGLGKEASLMAVMERRESVTDTTRIQQREMDSSSVTEEGTAMHPQTKDAETTIIDLTDSVAEVSDSHCAPNEPTALLPRRTEDAKNVVAELAEQGIRSDVAELRHILALLKAEDFENANFSLGRMVPWNVSREGWARLVRTFYGTYGQYM